jgi:predicted Zn-dependent protease
MISLSELLLIAGIVIALVKARSMFKVGVTKSLGFETMSPDDETAIGREWLLEIGRRQRVAIERDERVRGILRTLQQAGRFRFARYLAFRLDTPGINAMALPGGHVLVTRGLMELADVSDDELAGILAHEIGHIELGHSRKALIRSNRTKALNLVLSVVGRQPGAAVGMATSLAELGISREAELEADAFAVSLLRQTPFRPEGLTAFLGRARRDERLPNWMTFLSTHPAVEERVEALRAQGVGGREAPEVDGGGRGRAHFTRATDET